MFKTEQDLLDYGVFFVFFAFDILSMSNELRTMILNVDLCKLKGCGSLRLPIATLLVVFLSLNVISTTDGLNLYQVRSIIMDNGNNSYEIAGRLLLFRLL